MSEDGTDQTQVVGQLPPMTGRHVIITRILLVLLAGLIALSIYTDHWSSLIIVVGFNALSLVLRFRPPTVVDASGIRRPWQRPRFVSWADVESVAGPQPGGYTVRLTLVSGKTLTLHDIRAEQSAAVAELGGKQVAKPPRLTLPPPPPARRTDQDIEADVARRAQALAERGKLLDAEYRRLQH